MRTTVKLAGTIAMTGLVVILSVRMVTQQSATIDSRSRGVVIVPTVATSQPDWIPFDYAAAWGVPGIDDESVVVSIVKVDDGEGDSGRDANGLQCSGNFQAGMSQLTPNPPIINPGQPLPPPDLTGVLSDTLIYSIPYIVPDATYDLATHFDDPSLDGTMHFEYIVFSGILTTPTGYSAPVSGDGIIASYDILSHGGDSFAITTILIEREWQTLQQARQYVKGFAKENAIISDAVRDTGYQPITDSEGPVEELIEQFGLAFFNQCVLNGQGFGCLIDLAGCRESARNAWENFYADCVRDHNDTMELAALARAQRIAFADDFNTDDAAIYAGILGSLGGVCGLPLGPVGSGFFAAVGANLGYHAGNANGRAKLRRLARDIYLFEQRQAELVFKACFDDAAGNLEDDIAQCDQDFFDCIAENCDLPVP